MRNSDPSRKELFALVWEHPATLVARELGISDVALGKLCKLLQLPKPPRGYWSKVASGKTTKRPPLSAYRVEVEQRLRKQVKSKNQVPLSKLQFEILNHVLAELSGCGVDIKACKLVYGGIRSIPPELAAHILIALQAQYEKWLTTG